MKKIKTILEGVFIIEPDVYGDHRGWFTESYSRTKFEKLGLNYTFIQDNHSFSKQKGTLRGIHYQIGEMAQTKLVRVTKGEVLDVVVDLRLSSPTYKKWISVKLSADNYKQLLIPKGFGHGFVTLTENVEFQYKVDNYYSINHERSIFYADKDINIEWGVENPILSDKDKNAPTLKSCNEVFK